MPVMSRRFYVASYLLSAIAGLAFFSVSTLLIHQHADLVPAGILTMTLGYGAAVYALVVLLVCVYRLWSHLPAEYARTTPGKAVGFLLIPFFNLYWMFQAFWGWMKDYNAMADKLAPDLRRMPAGLALAMCIVNIITIPIGVIPLVGSAAALVGVVLRECSSTTHAGRFAAFKCFGKG